ncbi:hypothetical protein Dsin_008038 [Dipteronia sinensis]|uniref:Uncharacterized protein n=1 Tax=Dipteronia sinensis TaxID=43782 RepID=A0AAE0B1A4_9ROSI|nr:hypothetical protein Dsin_008038 [Dipteronia sinensis]
MSVFGSSTTSAICADYFGDEFGLPLPPPQITKNNKTVVSKSTTTLLQNPVDNQSNSSNTKPRRVALAFAPNFDGLDFFETLVLRSN